MFSKNKQQTSRFRHLEETCRDTNQITYFDDLCKQTVATVTFISPTRELEKNSDFIGASGVKQQLFLTKTLDNSLETFHQDVNYRARNTKHNTKVVGAMTITSAALLLLILQLSRALNHPARCQTTKSLSDYILLGHNYKTTIGITFERCTFNCEMDEQCLSVNYFSSTKTCEYNNQTQELQPLKMVWREQWVYIGSAIRGPACDGPCAPATSSLKSDCGSNNETLAINSTCKGTALGMESGVIKDNQIQFSSLHLLMSQINCGRANRPNSTWFPLTDDLRQWYQVTFDPQVKVITGVGTQGSDVMWNWVISYSVDYKLGDGQWMEYKENCQKKVFQGNTQDTRQQVVKTRVTNPFKAGAVRIRPITFYGRIALRVELFGCDVLS